MLRVELAQVAAEGSKEENAGKLEAIMRGSRADVVVFPEYSLGARLESADALAEPVDGAIMRRLASAAAEAGVLALLGILERADGGPYNSIVALGGGDAVVVHRKAVLFDALGHAESRYVRAGDMPLTVLEIGGFSLGLATCFELRFPEIFRALADAGADAFVVPSAWYAGHLKEEQWLVSAAARAMENVSYMVAVDSAGRAFVGRSLVVNPWGHVELDLGRGERVAEWIIHEEAVREARAELPLLGIARGLPRPPRVRRMRAPGA
ncbi:MAG: nitrilase-related carbon-nitrogen hydrolase [Conexivisphaera sp.]